MNDLNFIILMVVGLITAVVFLTVLAWGQGTNMLETINAMGCNELLDGIKDKKSQYEGYVYIDTWIEKECWK